MILRARIVAVEDVETPSVEGLSIFDIDIEKSQPGLDMWKIQRISGFAVNANEVFFNNYEISATNLVGTKGQDFKIIFHGMNTEECLIAGKAWLGYAALQKAATYVKARSV